MGVLTGIESLKGSNLKRLQTWSRVSDRGQWVSTAKMLRRGARYRVTANDFILMPIQKQEQGVLCRFVPNFLALARSKAVDPNEPYDSQPIVSRALKCDNLIAGRACALAPRI